MSVAVKSNDVVVVADRNNFRIRLVATDGTVSTLAGIGTPGFADGPGATAKFTSPRGVAVMANGNIVMTDSLTANRIRLIFPNGDVTTLAGSEKAGHVDGDGTTAQFYSLDGVAVISNSKVVVVESDGQRLRLINASTTTAARRALRHPAPRLLIAAAMHHPCQGHL